MCTHEAQESTAGCVTAGACGCSQLFVHCLSRGIFALHTRQKQKSTTVCAAWCLKGWSSCCCLCEDIASADGYTPASHFCLFIHSWCFCVIAVWLLVGATWSILTFKFHRSVQHRIKWVWCERGHPQEKPAESDHPALQSRCWRIVLVLWQICWCSVTAELWETCCTNADTHNMQTAFVIRADRKHTPNNPHQAKKQKRLMRLALIGKY